MDLDELDGPVRAPPRTSRFAPKASKLKPQPKPKPNPVPISPHKTEPEPLSIPNSDPDLSMSIDGKVVEDVVQMDVDAKSADDVANDGAIGEEEDYVVREIDVFFNPSLDPNTQLYLFQYPLRPCWRPYELEERCVEVRLKPTSSEVEIDLSMNPDTKNYDADGDHKMKITKETLSSSSMKPAGVKGIAVGMLIGNKLHINPIHAAVQLRPSRIPAVPTKKTGGPKSKEGAIKSEDLKDEKSPGPSWKQNNPSGRPNEDDEAEENWIPLKHYSANSELSARYLEKMAGTESSHIPFSMSTYDYINSICPGANTNNSKPIGLALRDLRSLPLEERLRTWFREHPSANRFATLKHLAPDDPIEDVFVALQKVACLVQGLWVPKSSLLFEGGLDLLARDYVLLLFSKSPTISYSQLENLKPKISKVVKGILCTLANDRPTLRDWKFKATTDTDFLKSKDYEDIILQQNRNWERVEKPITENILGTEKAAVTKKPLSKPDMASKPGAPRVSSSTPVVRSSNGTATRTSMSDETREALPKVLQKLFRTQSVCSFQHICNRLREMALVEVQRPKGMSNEGKAAASAVDGPQEELIEIINQVATSIHGVYVLKKSPEYPDSDPFRKVVIDLLLAEGPNAKLKKASVLAAAKVQLHKDISDQEYNKVLKELCVSHGATWSLKRGDGNPA